MFKGPYGFIRADESEVDFFFPLRSVHEAHRGSIRPGDRVEFRVTTCRRRERGVREGLMAAEIEIISGGDEGAADANDALE